MAPSFHLFATDAFDAEEAGRICEQILQRQGTKSKMDLRQQPPAAVLSVLASSGWFRQVFGDKRFCFDDWYQTDCHEDGSCRLSVRHPSASRMVQVRGVVLESSRNTRDESRGQYIFKGVKDAKHTAAFIITVLALDHIGGASSRDWSKYWPGTRPPSHSSPPEEADAAQGIEDEEPGAPPEEETPFDPFRAIQEYGSDSGSDRGDGHVCDTPRDLVIGTRKARTTPGSKPRPRKKSAVEGAEAQLAPRRMPSGRPGRRKKTSYNEDSDGGETDEDDIIPVKQQRGRGKKATSAGGKKSQSQQKKKKKATSDDSDSEEDEEEAEQSGAAVAQGGQKKRTLCSVSRCNKQSQGPTRNGMCKKHFRQQSGGVLVSKEKLCSVSECTKQSQGPKRNGMCKNHHKEWAAQRKAGAAEEECGSPSHHYKLSLGQVHDLLPSPQKDSSIMESVAKLLRMREGVLGDARAALQHIADRTLRITGYDNATTARSNKLGQSYTREQLLKQGVNHRLGEHLRSELHSAGIDAASAVASAPNRSINDPPMGCNPEDPNLPVLAAEDERTLAGLYKLLRKTFANDPEMLSHHEQNFTERIVFVGGAAYFPILRWMSVNPLQDAAGDNQAFYVPGEYRAGALPAHQLNRDVAAANRTKYNKKQKALDFHRNVKGASIVPRPVGGSVSVNDTACEYAFSGLQAVNRMLACRFTLHTVDLIDVGTLLFNQLVDNNAYHPTYLRYNPGTNIFSYTNHVRPTHLNPLQLMLNTPTKSQTYITGYGAGEVCSAGWMACFGTPSGVCPVREQVDSVDIEVAVRANTPPYDDQAFDPPAGQTTWAVILEGLSPMVFSWHSEKNRMDHNHYVYHR